MGKVFMGVLLALIVFFVVIPIGCTAVVGLACDAAVDQVGDTVREAEAREAERRERERKAWERETAQTRRVLEAAARTIRDFSADHDIDEKTAEDLADNFRDQWGGLLSATFFGGSVNITSAGPDGRHGTGDDLREVVEVR